MGNIPLDNQLIIDELVEFWQTNNEPHDLFEHVRNTLRQGCNSLTFFLLTVRDDLRKGKRCNYSASSVVEFRQFLEVEYRRLYQRCAERQKAETQAVAPVKLERKHHHYENVCWSCQTRISSTIDIRCKNCGWYICSRCGSCSPDCNSTYNPAHVDVEDVDPFLDMLDDLTL